MRRLVRSRLVRGRSPCLGTVPVVMLCRWASSGVRVRFAPSPTGFLHLGGARTALFNYLFARRHEGTFIVRVEDTDQTRFVPGAEDHMLDSLAWLGIEPDESVRHGGSHGPYRQSERLPMYRDAAHALIQSGSAYRCFCTQERLAALRTSAARRGVSSTYDRKCYHLPADVVAQKLADGVPHTVRLLVPLQRSASDVVHVDDLVRGTVTTSLRQVDDQILLKSDGFPTYHLANVVDDHAMEISHVIRGEEWLSSTPKHMLLYRAFGWKAPAWAHLPLLVNTDGSKLSKRQNDASLDTYKDQGYVPEAMVNFLSSLGWTPSEASEEAGVEQGEEVLQLSQLIRAFDVSAVHRGGAAVSVKKLDWFNGQHSRRLLSEPGSDGEAALVRQVRPFLEAQLPEVTSASDAYVASVLRCVQGRVSVLPRVAQLCPYFFRDPDLGGEAAKELARKCWRGQDTVRLVQACDSALQALPVPWTTESVTGALTAVREAHDVSASRMFQPLRLIVTGTRIGAGVPETMATLGAECVLRRLKRTHLIESE